MRYTEIQHAAAQADALSWALKRLTGLVNRERSPLIREMYEERLGVTQEAWDLVQAQVREGGDSMGFGPSKAGNGGQTGRPAGGPKREWKKIEREGSGQGIFKWQEEGESLEGVYEGQKPGKYGQLGKLRVEDGALIVFAIPTALNSMLEDVRVGDEIKIIYTGDLVSESSGNSYKNFELFSRGGGSDKPFPEAETPQAKDPFAPPPGRETGHAAQLGTGARGSKSGKAPSGKSAPSKAAPSGKRRSTKAKK